MCKTCTQNNRTKLKVVYLHKPYLYDLSTLNETAVYNAQHKMNVLNYL